MATHGYSNGISNGYSNGHNGHNVRANENTSNTLKDVVQDLCKELTLKRSIVLRSGDSGDPYAAELNKSIEIFKGSAADLINKAESDINKRVQAKLRDQARRYVDDLKDILSNVDRIGHNLNSASHSMVNDLFSSNKRIEATRVSHEMLNEIAK